MSNMGEDLTPEGTLHLSIDYQWIQWVDTNGVSRLYKLQNDMSEDVEYQVGEMNSAVGNIASTVVNEARDNE